VNNEGCISRRALICHGVSFIAAPTFVSGAALDSAEPVNEEDHPKLRIGLVTDLHYADQPPRINRYYRETPAKLAEAAKQFRQEKTDLVIELGDMIDVAESLSAEKALLRRIARDFRATPGQHHYALGNHCVWNLTKQEFLETVGQKRSYYSFDRNGCHFVILDACFRADGQPYGRQNFQWTDANLPPKELEWLESDLKHALNPTIVFVHQRLDALPPLGVKNAPEVQRILEQSGKVRMVFQGHDHLGDYREIGRIAYCTLRAMIEGSGAENNAYAVLDILPDDVLRITGFRKQTSHTVPRPAQQTSLNLPFASPHTGHVSGAWPITVCPQTSHT